jgi:hypothetical protein
MHFSAVIICFEKKNAAAPTLLQLFCSVVKEKEVEVKV